MKKVDQFYDKISNRPHQQHFQGDEHFTGGISVSVHRIESCTVVGGESGATLPYGREPLPYLKGGSCCHNWTSGRESVL